MVVQNTALYNFVFSDTMYKLQSKRENIGKMDMT